MSFTNTKQEYSYHSLLQKWLQQEREREVQFERRLQAYLFSPLFNQDREWLEKIRLRQEDQLRQEQIKQKRRCWCI
jgi:hypothetical protein